MALDPIDLFYSEGSITLTNGSDLATGEFTAWDPAVLPYDILFANDGADGASVVKEVLAVDQIRLAKPWSGPTLTDAPYFILRWIKHTDPRIYGVRVSDYLTRLKAIPENLEEVVQEIDADRQAVDAAMAALAGIEAAVEADRQAVATDRTVVEAGAAAAAASADEAEAWAQAASSGVLPDNSVTNVKLADMAVNTLKGRVTAGTGDPEDLTPAQALTLLGRAWRTSTRYRLVAAGTITIPVPVNARIMRLTGITLPSDFVFAAGNNAPFMRLSLDGGMTFRSGASDYSYGYEGNVGTGHVANGAVVASYMQFGAVMSVANVAQSWELTAMIPAAASSERFSLRSTAAGYTTEAQLLTMFGAAAFAGRPTHIWISPINAPWLAGSVVIAEFDE